MSELAVRLATALDRCGMPARGWRIGVAVSGGADSVFLLRGLHELGRAAAVLHVNHQLRGAESDSDAAFARDLAGELKLPFYTATAPVTEGNVEQEARRARYTFFSECMAGGVCDVVATGHTLDDQAETVLGRFLRGSGTAGLSGILPVTAAGIVRPLLRWRRAEIREWLVARQISWREDASNANREFLRNRLRLDVMPQLTELNPSLAPTLAATAEWSQAEELYWAAEIDRLATLHLRRDREAVLVEMGLFLHLPLAVQRRLLRRGIELVRGSLRGIDFRHVEAIRGLTETLEGSGRIQLPGLDAYRSFDWLRFAPTGYDTRLERNFETELRVPGRTALPEHRLAIEMELVTGPHVYNDEVGLRAAALDSRKCMGSFLLRNWRPGDRLESRKIKTLFQEHRIPLWQRRHWPVIALGDSIVWTRLFGAAPGYAAGPDSESVLLVRETGESNHPFEASVDLMNQELQRATPGAEAS